MLLGADSWTLRTGGTDRIIVDNTRTYIPGYVRIDGGMEIATNEDNDSPELTFKRTPATNAGGTDDIGHIRIGDSSMNFILNNDSDADAGTFNFRKVVGGSEVGATIDTTTVKTSSVEIGSRVVLEESSDRADLLQITGETATWAGLQIRNSSNEGRWSYMTDGEFAGLYNDEDEQWHVYMTEGGGTNLYYGGTSKFSTTSGGVHVTGDIDGATDIYVADQIIHTGDTDTYMQFNAADSWRVVTGGVSRFDVNNSTSTFQTDVTIDGGHQLYVGDGADNTRLHIKKADNNISDHLIFYNGTTRMGEIGCQDEEFLRINQVTGKHIYTPRYIRADAGFYVDGTAKGINGSGNFIGGTIAGASDYGTLVRSDTGDLLTGSTYTFDSTTDQKIILKGAPNPFIRFKEGDTDKAYVQWSASGYVHIKNQEDGSGIRVKDTFDFSYDGTTFHEIWHAGNDGSGSGLDADMLDGLQSTSFVRADNDNVVAGDIVLDKTTTATSSNGGTDSHSLILRAQNWDTSASDFAASPGGAKNFDWRVKASTRGTNQTISDLQFFADAGNSTDEIPLTLHGMGDGSYYRSTDAATFKGHVTLQAPEGITYANIYLPTGGYIQGGLHSRDAIPNLTSGGFSSGEGIDIGAADDASIYYDGANDILYHDCDHTTLFRTKISASGVMSDQIRLRYDSPTFVELYYGGDEKLSTAPAGINVQTTKTNSAGAGNLEGAQINLQCFTTNTGAGAAALRYAMDTFKDPYGIYGHQHVRKTTDDTVADQDWTFRIFNATTGAQGLVLHPDTGTATTTKFRAMDSWSNWAPLINGVATYMPWAGPSQTDYDSSQGYRYTEIGNGGGWGHLEMKHDIGGYWDVSTPGSDMHGRIVYYHHGLNGSEDWADATLDDGRWEFHVAYKQPSPDADARYDATQLNGGSTNYGDDTLQMIIEKDVVKFTGDIVPFYSFSDARLKERITAIESQEALNKVLQLTGVTFEWKDDPKRGTQMGMVAQQVAEVVPEVVDEQSRIGDENTYMRVDYEKIVPLLVEGMKQQQKQIELLQQQLEHLTNNNK